MTAVSLLLLASLGLLVGPLCGSLGDRSRAIRELTDGFTLFLVAGLCVAFVLPHVVHEIGVAGLALVAVGVGLTTVGHRLGHGGRGAVGLIATGLALHVMFDGAVLSSETPLGLAVVAHRLPVGFAIVAAVQASGRPSWLSWTLAFVLILATAVGYFWGTPLLAQLPDGGTAGVEAIVAGALLHVVFAPHWTADDGQCHHTHEHPRHIHDPAHGHEHDHHDCGHDHHHDCDHDHHHHGHDHDHHDHDHHDHEHHDHEHHDHDHHDHEHHDHDGHGHHHHGRGHAHDHGHHHHAHSNVRDRHWSTAGAMLAVAIMLAGASHAGHHGEASVIEGFLETLGVLLLESAPALVIGYALAGVVPFLLTPSRTSSLARGGKFGQSLRGVAFGLPLPVCSCGVLPLYESLIRRGAPPAAAMAFFVATPELGLDAVLLSVPLLGSSLTIARVVAAFAVALLVALLVSGRSDRSPPVDQEVSTVEQSWGDRIREGLRFGFVEVFDHTMPWIALGLVIAAMAEPMLSYGVIGTIPPALQVPLAALVGVPVYVCASGATPIAALALHKGLTAGAAIAFLIAGPATNVTTFGVLARLHGKRTAIIFGVCVTGLAILAGWTVDALGITGAPVLDDAHSGAEAHASWFAILCVTALAALVVSSLLRQGPRGALRQILEPIHSH